MVFFYRNTICHGKLYGVPTFKFKSLYFCFVLLYLHLLRFESSTRALIVKRLICLIREKNT